MHDGGWFQDEFKTSSPPRYDHCEWFFFITTSHHPQAEVASEQELSRALRVKVDRMKEECDKLSQELITKEEAHSLLLRRHQLLKQDLDDKVRPCPYILPAVILNQCLSNLYFSRSPLNCDSILMDPVGSISISRGQF